MILLTLILSTITLAAESKSDVRGVWLQPYAITEKTRVATLDEVRRLQLNTVYLRTPTINAQGDTHHGSGNVADFTAALKQLRQSNVTVHAWITNKMRMGKDQVDFTSEQERTKQAQWAVAILDRWKGLAGVHLDYIRYSKWDRPNAKKMNGVTATVRSIRTAMRKSHPGKQLTAAVFTADFSYLGGRWGAGGSPQWDGDVPAWFQQWQKTNANNVYLTRPAALHRKGEFKEFGAKHLYGPTFFHMQQDPVTVGKNGKHHIDAWSVMLRRKPKE